jgi:hypothetical protein
VFWKAFTRNIVPAGAFIPIRPVRGKEIVLTFSVQMTE